MGEDKKFLACQRMLHFPLSIYQGNMWKQLLLPFYIYSITASLCTFLIFRGQPIVKVIVPSFSHPLLTWQGWVEPILKVIFHGAFEVILLDEISIQSSSADSEMQKMLICNRYLTNIFDIFIL